jgi:hypothetical protein
VNDDSWRALPMTHGQAPDQSRVNPEGKDFVLRTRISLGGTEVMGA